MSDRLSGLVIDFFNKISYYIMQEYPNYYKNFHNEKDLAKTFEMVEKYYLGGNNAEDTAGFMVDYLKGKENGRPI